MSNRSYISEVFLLLMLSISLAYASSAKHEELKSEKLINEYRVQATVRIAKPVISIKESWSWGIEGKLPKTSILQLIVVVDKKPLFIPMSAFVDLANPKQLLIESKDDGFIVTIKGGETSTAYTAQLFFNKGSIVSKKIFNEEFPDDSWEEIKYSFPSPEL
jgi:hypothetical protein